MIKKVLGKAIYYILVAAMFWLCVTAFTGIKYREPEQAVPVKSEVTETETAVPLSCVVTEAPAEHASEGDTDGPDLLDGPVVLPVKPNAGNEPWYTDWEWEILAIIIYQELGGDAASDIGRLAVGNVFLNRVLYSEHFPDSFEEVATQYGQYGTLHWTGIKWPDRAQNPGEAHAVERAWEIARRVLDGERIFDEDVIWQAEFAQGTETVLTIDGMYFCK